jgi:hypothetical protein
MLARLELALGLAALLSLLYSIFCLLMTLHHRQPGTSMWYWRGMWSGGVWALPVTARGERYREQYLRALLVTIGCLSAFHWLSGRH